VLGLVKAQQVKNAVIVPVARRAASIRSACRAAARRRVRGEAIDAYKTFLFGLLDLTDNIDAAARWCARRR
jgi:glutamate dehydrogenase